MNKPHALQERAEEMSLNFGSVPDEIFDYP
jgi:hypothetical protein